MTAQVHKGATAAQFQSGDPEQLQTWLLKHWNCVYVQAISDSRQISEEGEREQMIGFWFGFFLLLLLVTGNTYQLLKN